MNPTLIGLSTAAMIALSCGGGHEPGSAGPSSAAPGSVSQQMHGHFRAIRSIYHALLVDDLATAKAHARELSRLPDRTGSQEWDDAARFVRAEADRVVGAGDPNEARSLSTGMATFCADCHMFRAEPVVFRPAVLPPDDGSLAAAMARHEWAADTMWLGVIAPSTDLWRNGLAEMASVPKLIGRGERAAEVDTLRARLDALAKGSSELGGQGDRARRLAEIMDVCAACHAITRPRGTH
ncbi:MAG TPA: hypothetical protein VIG06_07570 [Kofleriaceae bacterium]|jgi:mono/diheme cytochrome c family protein